MYVCVVCVPHHGEPKLHFHSYDQNYFVDLLEKTVSVLSITFVLPAVTAAWSLEEIRFGCFLLDKVSLITTQWSVSQARARD